jgi:hypothetical protein
MIEQLGCTSPGVLKTDAGLNKPIFSIASSVHKNGEAADWSFNAGRKCGQHRT